MESTAACVAGIFWQPKTVGVRHIISHERRSSSEDRGLVTSVTPPVRTFEGCEATEVTLHTACQGRGPEFASSLGMALSRIVTHVLLAAAILAGAHLAACSRNRLPRPQRTAGDAKHTDEAALLATHPPPAALPEIISERPSARAKWLGGTWVWRRNSWVWERGGWIENPEKLLLVESQVRYTKEGLVEFCPRRWVNAEGQVMAAPAVVTPAGTPPTPQLREEHTVP